MKTKRNEGGPNSRSNLFLFRPSAMTSRRPYGVTSAWLLLCRSHVCVVVVGVQDPPPPWDPHDCWPHPPTLTWHADHATGITLSCDTMGQALDLYADKAYLLAFWISRGFLPSSSPHKRISLLIRFRRHQRYLNALRCDICCFQVQFGHVWTLYWTLRWTMYQVPDAVVVHFAMAQV